MRRCAAAATVLAGVLGLAGCMSDGAKMAGASEPKVAAKPLYRDPVYDGAADPVVVWNRAEKKWFMYYTNRRANVQGLKGVAWCHGTPIGIAESSDGGATWTYRGTAKIDYGSGEFSYWAPDILWDGGTYHMFLTFVPGMHETWTGTREIVHLTSADGVSWQNATPIKLASDRVIDACVARLPNGRWRMWYNNERDRKSIYHADSADLVTWEEKGKVLGDQPGEGPKVFRWRGAWWMIVDVWDGQAVYRSEDAERWERQAENILRGGGRGADDGTKGLHADVVVSGERAYLFYFTHPGRVGENEKKDAGYETRRSSIQVVELETDGKRVRCDRDKPVRIQLSPPAQ